MSARALIVGAGPAGLSAAMQLSTWCDSVEVVEARTRTALRHTGEHVPPAGLTSLTTLGFGDFLNDPDHQISSGVDSCWGHDSPAGKDYFFTPAGCGKNLRRNVFDAALIRAAELQGVTFTFSTRLVNIDKITDGYTATFRQNTKSQTRNFDLVIDATGRNARAARLLGAKVARVDDMVGITATLEGCEASEDIGRLCIEAIDGGWWYGVQFQNGELLCTFMTDAARVSAHPGGAFSLWQENLRKTRTLAPLAATGVPADDVQVFDASTQSVHDLDHDGFLAVGDAAIAFDPLSSWGITKGILDGHQAAKALQHDRNGQSDALARFRAQRRTQYQTYRQQHAAMYRAEQRWPQSEFWQSRQRVMAES